MSRRILAMAICIGMTMISVGNFIPTPAEAAWSGASTTCESNQGGLAATCPTAQAACESWAVYYGTWVTHMDPAYDSQGSISHYTCFIRHFLEAGLDILGPTYPTCEPDEFVNGYLPSGCVKFFSGKGLGCPPGRCPDGRPTVGNPVTVPNGNKWEQETDFETAGPDVLRFVRYYNSFEQHGYGLGIGWRSNYDRRLWIWDATRTFVFRADGWRRQFTLVGGVWDGDSDVTLRLVKNASTWTLTDDTDTVETYDATGKLLSIVQRNGYQQTMTYNASNQLIAVTDSYGRQLTFTYTGSRLATMTDPDGKVYAYAYQKTIPYLEEANVLVSVTYPDETPTDPSDDPTRQYLYEDPTYPFALTGIIDENEDRYATFAYDDEGRAILSEHADANDHTEIEYLTDLTRKVTNALGQETTYHFQWVLGSRKMIQEERHASATVPDGSRYQTYDSYGFIGSQTDWNGNLTTFVNNSRGLQISRTEASGTSAARTITTAWHPTLRVPTQIQEPGKTTDFTYDANGLVLTRTETDTTGGPTNGQTRTWTYTYTANGLLETVDGPRTTVTDLTTNTYTTEGYLKTVTNALGHVTDITSHSSRGLPLILKDANGVETHLTYHPRGWLISTTVKSTQGDAVTTFAYDPTGQLTRMTRPDGSELNYHYDAAHRVIAVTNNLGERIDYTLDAAGNRITETVKSSTGGIVRTQSRTFDSISRLLTQIGAASQTTTTAYDANGDILAITDPLQHTTQQAFDALNRLIKVTDATNGEADYTYDGQDNLSTVADQRDLTTTYAYNGFGEVIQMTSPDTGLTTYQTDSAGNRLQQTDARGIVTTYTYDALNRVTTMQFPGNSAENVTYTYDAQTGGNVGLGRLTGIIDQSGTTTLVYDDRGNVLTDTRQIGGQTYTTQYQYDLADHLTQVIYPSGRLVTYQRDALGRVSAVTTQANASAAPQVLASGITYQPFGPMTTLTYGNGLTLTLSYDQDYRLTDIRTADGAIVIQDVDYTHDPADNITAITDALNASRSQTFAYDDLHRLTAASGSYPTLAYTYDGVGNRLTRTEGGIIETYTYATTSNQVQSVTGGGNTRAFSYSSNGQISTDNRGVGQVYDLGYNHQNRLTQLTTNSLADTGYLHNALGQRVIKDDLDSSADIHYHYDREGRLLAETDAQGTVLREYLHLEGLPLAVLDAGAGSSPTLDLILDNTDPGVTTTGTWTASTLLPGHEGSDYLEHATLGIPPGGELIDETSAQFQTTGVWTSASAVPGYEGTGYLERDSADGQPATLIVDNDTANFTALGQWNTVSGNPEAEGPNYRWHFKDQLSYTAQIIDNTDPGFNALGNWQTWTSSGHQGPDYRFHKKFPLALPPGAVIVDNWQGTTSSWWGSTQNVAGYYGTNYFWHSSTPNTWFIWTPNVPAAKDYHVYAWWPAHSTHASNASFRVFHAGGSTGGIIMNQRINGGQWNYLGTFPMAPNSDHKIRLWGEGNGTLVADAIAIVPTDAPLPTATWFPNITEADDYEISAKWTQWTGHATNAPFTIFHKDGSTMVPANQQQNGGQWNLLGTFTLEPNEDHRVELTNDQADGSVIADAVLVIPVNAPPNSATWTLPIVTSDDYEVYAKWATHPSHATDTPYTIHHAGGSTTVNVNQEINGGVWNLLGTYRFNVGAGHTIVVTDQANQTVVADAVRLVPASGMSNIASWTPAIAVSDDYDIYARWTSHTNRATDATYTVHHAGGSSSVTVNQRDDGGQWNLLGTFTMDPGANHRIELSDTANGTVVADAVYVVPHSANSDAVTWTSTLTNSEIVEVYAKWTAGADRSNTVTYTVHHSGGSFEVVVNQQQNGGQWNYLGQFAFVPGSNHRVEVTDSTDGVVVADAVRFVSIDGTSAGLFYVHSDHLGTPQKMTDGAQALVWDAVYKPFGEAQSITGTSSNNQRFPGQYFEMESGYAYNLARDYDPSTGRYVQSDPIGLVGGLNTYLYVKANPLRFTDPLGLETCGSGANDGLVPDNPFGFPFSPCCVQHDACYGTCRISKGTCDSNFLRCMQDGCKDYSGVAKWACEKTAQGYYAAVDNFGDSAYNDAQKDCKDGDC